MAIRQPSANPAPNRINRLEFASTKGTANSQPKRPGKLVRRLLAVACLGLLVADSAGCTLTSAACRAVKDADCVDEFMIGYRNRAMAEKAWHCRKDGYTGQTYTKEFKAGFIDGYLEVANGGLGCCPTVAPSKYWGWQYQSANGQAAINAWFAGYPLGVQAAEQEGVGHYQRIFTMGNPAPEAMAPSIPGTTSPFYLEDEMPDGEQGIEVLVPPAPDAVFNAPISPAMDDVPELIARRDIHSVDATFADDSIELSAPVGMLVEEPVELLPAGPTNDQIPISFE